MTKVWCRLLYAILAVPNHPNPNYAFSILHSDGVNLVCVQENGADGSEEDDEQDEDCEDDEEDDN